MKNVLVSALLSLFGALALEACAPINGEVETPRTPTRASSATTSGGETPSATASPSGDECSTSTNPVVLARCNERRTSEMQELLRNNERLIQAVTRVTAACETSRDPGVRTLCDAVNRVAPRPTAVTTVAAQPPVATPAPAPVAAPVPVATPAPAPASAGTPPMGMPMPGMLPGMMPGMGGTQTPFRVMPGGTIGNMSGPDGAAPWTSQGGIMGLSEFTIGLVNVPFPVEVFVNGVRVCHTQDGFNFTQVTFQGRTFCVVPPREAGNTDLSFLAHDPSRRQEVILRGWNYNSYVGVTSTVGTVTVHVTPARYRGRMTSVTSADFQ